MTSMELKKQIETDILRCLENIDKQSQNDKVETIRNLLDKYIHLTSCDYIMDDKDLNAILGFAKHNFANNSLSVYLGNRKIKVQPSNMANLCLIEATVSHLNKNGCLKKVPKFDKRDNNLPE